MNRFNTYEEFLNESLDPLIHLTQKQVDWCDKHIDGEWSVNSKGEVTVRKNLDFKDKSFDRFPVQFAPVNGSFYCRYCELTSLKGAPREVSGNFICYKCPNLVSLEGAPTKVEGSFECMSCFKLTSLKGAPKEVGGKFNCRHCYNLTSLKGAPQEVKGDFDCSVCSSLVSLEGAPQSVGGGFICDGCPKLPDWETDLIADYNEKRRTWEEVWKILHKETYRKAAQTGLI
jgi:hypothetical protein